MTILLYITLGYLLITTAILYLNRLDFMSLMSSHKTYFNEQAPQVNICIPARNEVNSIERCVRSAVNQQYPNYQVFVLDDGSTDGTSKILKKLEENYPEKLTIIIGKPKPDDWLGKSWACHQLSQQCRGEILVFIDADTWLDENTISRLIRTMGHDIIDFATIWPEQDLGTFWEKVTIPLVYFALLTLLPARYVYQTPKWLPSFLRKKAAPLFAAACGQFMAFKRKAYESIGGHASVKDKVVEDVELAKNIKRAGFSMNMYHGQNTVSCRMYTSGRELWEGFRKNFFAGFGYNVPPFITMAILQFIVFVLPAIALPFLILNPNTYLLVLDIGALGLILMQRITIDRWFSWKILYSFSHPLAVCWYKSLGIRVLIDYFNNISAQWKNRSI